MTASRFLSRKLHVVILPALIAVTGCEEIDVDEILNDINPQNIIDTREIDKNPWAAGRAAGRAAAEGGLPYNETPEGIKDASEQATTNYRNGYRNGYDGVIARAQEIEEKLREVPGILPELEQPQNTQPQNNAPLGSEVQVIITAMTMLGDGAGTDDARAGRPFNDNPASNRNVGDLSSDEDAVFDRAYRVAYRKGYETAAASQQNVRDQVQRNPGTLPSNTDFNTVPDDE